MDLTLETKYIIFFIFCVIAIPAGSILALVSRRFLNIVFIAMIVSLCESHMLEIMFVSRPDYRMVTRGIGCSLSEICAITLLFPMLLRSEEFKLKWFPPLIIPNCIFIVVIIISWFFVYSDLPLPSDLYCYENSVKPFQLANGIFEIATYPLFELSMVIRGLLVYWVVVNFLSVKQNFRYLHIAVIISIFYIFSVAVYQRYFMGIYRVDSTMSHPNGLATFAIMCLPIAWGGLFTLKRLSLRMINLCAVICCGISVALTVSRGGMIISGIVSVLVLIFILKRNICFKNVVLALGTCILMGIIVFKSFDTLQSRFSNDLNIDYEYRSDHNTQAMLMGQEHFWGVGMGNFSAMSWTRYAKLSQDLRNGKSFDTPGTPAHNLWFLTFAELGWPGLLSFAFIWLRYSYLMIRSARCSLDRSTYTWLVTSGIALLGLHLQELLNDGYRLTPIYLMIQVLMAAGVAIYCNQRHSD